MDVLDLLFKVLLLAGPGRLTLGQPALQLLAVALPLLPVEVGPLLPSVEVPGNGSDEEGGGESE